MATFRWHWSVNCRVKWQEGARAAIEMRHTSLKRLSLGPCDSKSMCVYIYIYISVINGQIQEVAEYRVCPTCSNTSWHVWDTNSDIKKDIWKIFEMKHGHDPNIIFHGMNNIIWSDGQHKIDVSLFTASTACMEKGFRVHCACKCSPTLIGGQPDVLSYDAFRGMTPAVLEPGCRCAPPKRVSACGLGTDAATSCLIGAVKRGCRQPGPGSQSRAAAALGTTDRYITLPNVLSTPGQEIRKPTHTLSSLTVLLRTVLYKKIITTTLKKKPF